MTATKPTLSIFTGAESFGLVYSEQNQINCKFAEVNVPLTTTSGNVSFNFLGKSRIIVVQGLNDGTGFSGATQNVQIRNFIARMEGQINSAIQTAFYYYDSFGVEYKVHAVDWTWSRSFTNPSAIIFTLMMKESF